MGFRASEPTYPNLTGDQSGQDFTAILLGMCRELVGGRKAQATALSIGRSAGLTDLAAGHVGFAALTTRANETQVWLLARATQAEIYSVDLAQL